MKEAVVQPYWILAAMSPEEVFKREGEMRDVGTDRGILLKGQSDTIAKLEQSIKDTREVRKDLFRTSQ